MTTQAITAFALATAVRTRFAAGWSMTDVIRYVVRVRTRDGFDDIFPSLAEGLLLVGLANRPLPAGSDPGANAYAQFALLKSLTDDLRASGLDQVLDEAREHAEHWLGQRPEASAPPASIAVSLVVIEGSRAAGHAVHNPCPSTTVRI